MAPQPLLGRYKLYKIGTARLIEWLGKTGGQCIDLKDVLRSLRSKLSTKAHALKTLPKKIEITTRELILLAQAILDSDPPAEVPLAILDITRDVIKGREECSSWYAAQAVTDDSRLSDENESHRHFITVLREVLHLLTQAHQKQNLSSQSLRTERRTFSQQKKKKKNKAQQSEPSPEDRLGNLFAVLQLEEPSPSSLGGSVADAAQPRRTSTARTDFVLEDKGEDAAFATWCFLQDLDDVRSYVNATWKEYAKGEISFLAASTVTDTAFGLLHSADDAFTREEHFGKSTDWSDYMTFLGLSWWNRDQTIWLCPAAQTTRAKLPDSDVNVVQLLCPIAYLCLRGYSIDARVVCEALSKNQPVPTTCNKHGFHKFHDFSCVLFRMAPELHSMGHAMNRCNHMEIDEFVRGLATMHITGVCPMWMVVACQIYLDLSDLLAEHMDHGVHALQLAFRETEDISARLTEHMVKFDDSFADVAGAVGKLRWTARASSCFEQSAGLPPENDHKPDNPKHAKVKRELGFAASTMERKLTAHAGGILANVKFGLLDAGVAIANHSGIVLSTAHLYKALRAMGALATNWPDMDFLLATFKNKQPLVAKLGAKYDGEAAYRHFMISLGVPATEYARGGRRTSKAPVEIKEARKISITSPLVQKMSDRQADWQKCGVGSSKTKTIEIVLDSLTRSKLDVESTTHKRQSFTPVQLLSTYKKTIITEEPTINFDFTSFTLTCAAFLNGVVATASTKPEMPKPHHFTTVADLLRYKDKASVRTVASALADYISVHGRTFINSAHAKCSGRIPKHLRPSISHDRTRGDGLLSMMCTMFDYSNTKFVLSGQAVAAYHPSVSPGMRNDDFSGQPLPGDSIEQHPEELMPFGVVIPDSVMEETVTNMMKNPAKFVKAKVEMAMTYFDEHAAGNLSEESLRVLVRSLIGLEIEPMDLGDERVASMDSKSRSMPWSFRVPPSDMFYDDFVTSLEEAQDSRLKGFVYGQPIVVPVASMRSDD